MCFFFGVIYVKVGSLQPFISRWVWMYFPLEIPSSTRDVLHVRLVNWTNCSQPQASPSKWYTSRLVHWVYSWIHFKVGFGYSYLYILPSIGDVPRLSLVNAYNLSIDALFSLYSLLFGGDIYGYIDFVFGIRLKDIGYRFSILNCALDRMLKWLYVQLRLDTMRGFINYQYWSLDTKHDINLQNIIS